MKKQIEITIKIPADAYDLKLGNDLMGNGLLFKTPCNNLAGWVWTYIRDYPSHRE